MHLMFEYIIITYRIMFKIKIDMKIVYNTRVKSVDAEILLFLAAILDFSIFFAFPPVSSNGTFFGKTGISQENIAVKIISV